MTHSDDPTGDMSGSLTAHDAERVLAEGAGPGEPSDATAPLARFLAILRTPPADDQAAGAAIIASVAAEIRASNAAPPAVRAPRGRVHRRISTKAAAFAFAGILATGTAAAAATGSLPNSVQQVVAGALAHVHINVPHHHHTGAHAPTVTSDPGAVSPSPAHVIGSGVDHPGQPGVEGTKKSTVPTSAAKGASSSHKTHTTTAPPTATTGGTTTGGGATGGTSGSTTGTTHTNNGKSALHGPPTSVPGKAKGVGKHTTSSTATTTTTQPAHGKGLGRSKGTGSTHAHGQAAA